jgi:hypothetical protein
VYWSIAVKRHRLGLRMDDEIAGFVGITGAPEEAARYVLDMCSGDLGQAIQLWYNDEELQRNLLNPSAATAAATSSSSSAPPPIPHSTRPGASTGHEDPSGAIVIDSDDDDDVQMLERDNDDFTQAATVARTAQEEEDAAMAKRLQEELYGGAGGGGPAALDEDGVRAPMARVTETLVAPTAGDAWGDDDDAEVMNARILEQLRRRRQGPRKITSDTHS